MTAHLLPELVREAVLITGVCPPDRLRSRAALTSVHASLRISRRTARRRYGRSASVAHHLGVSVVKRPVKPGEQVGR
jgi:hypothetical protein